jgi:cobalamin synthase
LTAALAALALGRLLVPLWRAAIGGVTGDLLGASVELGELLALALLTVTLA